MNLAVIGATGLVGEEILKVLQEKKITLLIFAKIPFTPNSQACYSK